MGSKCVEKFCGQIVRKEQLDEIIISELGG